MNNGGPTAQIIDRDGWNTDKDFVGHRKPITCVVSDAMIECFIGHEGNHLSLLSDRGVFRILKHWRIMPAQKTSNFPPGDFCYSRVIARGQVNGESKAKTEKHM